MTQLPNGLWPVMLTPFKDDTSLDLDGLKRLTEFYMATGADGLFANCLSSEMFQLTNEERLQITKTVLTTVKEKIPVIATGSFGTNMDLSASFVKKLYDLGVAAVVISTSQPCNELDSDDIFKSKINSLIDKTGSIPLGLYECPVPYKRLVSPSILKWLASSDRFLYHKDTSCRLDSINEKLEAVKGTDLGIYNAHVPTGIASIRSGVKGLSPIAANLYPELFTYLLQYMGDVDKQEKIIKLNQNLDMMDTIIHHNYPFVAKLFLQKRGFQINPNSRIPRLSMSTQDHIKLETVMQVFRQLAEELDIEIVHV